MTATFLPSKGRPSAGQNDEWWISPLNVSRPGTSGISTSISSPPISTVIVVHTSLGGKSSCYHKVLALGFAAICSLNVPFALVGVEFRSSNDSFKRSILLEVKDLIAMVEIGLEFSPVGIIGRPMPVFVNLWNSEFVNGNRTVDSCTGIDILSKNQCLASSNSN